MQNLTQKFVSECGKAQVFVESDMAIGVFHDFLMALKGLMVDRMVKAHQEQVEQAKSVMNFSDVEGSVEACQALCDELAPFVDIEIQTQA